MHLFIGTYISDSDETIYHLQIDNTLEVVSKNLIHAGKNPSFLIFTKNKERMYCVNELSKDADSEWGAVSSLKKEGDSYVPHKRLSTQGDHPCHISVSHDEKLLFATNYTSGSLSVYALNEDGDLETLIDKLDFYGSSVHSDRQESSHPHQTLSSPCGKYLFLTDLGGGQN